MSKFDAAISVLNRFSRKSFGYSEVETAQFHAAIRVLEAAGKVDKDRADWCLQWADNNNFDTLESQHGITRRQWLGTMAKLSILVDALPDKED